MPWLQVTLATDRGRIPLIEAVLENLGALAVTLTDAGDEPQLEPAPGTTPLWGEVQVAALFDPADPDTPTQEVIKAGIAACNLHPGSEPIFESVEDQAWEHTWRDDFAPTHFGRRLWVCPRGQDPLERAETDVIVVLEPGLAFGTGHHPTTALCLQWLDGANLAAARVTDYGCGSGILAISALKLGAARAVAVDHDPQALEATRANADENGVAQRLVIMTPEAVPRDHPPASADYLVANILAAPLIELAPTLARLVGPGGHLALSGLLEDQIESVQSAYRPWFDLGAPRLLEGWVLLAGHRLSQGRQP